MFVFRDYLPHIVGDDAMRRLLGPYPGYNPDVDPRISNVFATAAYRFAHLAIQPVLARLGPDYREDPQFPSVPLFKAFFTPWRIIFEGEHHSLDVYPLSLYIHGAMESEDHPLLCPSRWR